MFQSFRAFVFRFNPKIQKSTLRATIFFSASTTPAELSLVAFNSYKQGLSIELILIFFRWLPEYPKWKKLFSSCNNSKFIIVGAIDNRRLPWQSWEAIGSRWICYAGSTIYSTNLCWVRQKMSMGEGDEGCPPWGLDLRNAKGCRGNRNIWAGKRRSSRQIMGISFCPKIFGTRFSPFPRGLTLPISLWGETTVTFSPVAPHHP